MAKNMRKTYKNQALLKSYPQENEKNDIFFTDNPLFFINKNDLSTDLSTGAKKEGGIVKKFHHPLVKFFHPNKLKLFLIKRKCGGFFLKVINRFKILLFSRKKGGDFMDYEHLLRLKKILDCFFLECCTLTDYEDDIIEKETTFDKYSISLICKRKD